MTLRFLALAATAAGALVATAANAAMTISTLGSGQNAFEITDVAGIAAAVPEPACWTLMIAGIGATGAMLRTQRQRRLVPIRVRS